ncbi:MAG: hypothetical protein KC613_10195 [Myxococcales bacterium]|nr:hypothetical protein [Myxococcales bacterium]MCB9525178.1 hypothetical protein [Myxococcales bacterium]
MLDILDTAHPILTLTVVAVLLVALWMISRLHREIRVLQSRLDSVEAEQKAMDEAVEMLSPSHALQAQVDAEVPITGSVKLPAHLMQKPEQPVS